MSNFPTAGTTFSFTPSAGAAVPYDQYAIVQQEIVALSTSLRNGVAQAMCHHSTTQSLADATVTALTFDTEDYDVGSLHSTSASPTRMTVPASLGGMYLVCGKVAYAQSSAGGVRVARLRKNGADISTQVTIPTSTSATVVASITTVLQLAAADYVELYGFQNSGGALNTGDGTSRFIQNELSMARLW